MEGDGDLVAGTALTVPEVKTSGNDANTFKPYNPGEITGPTTPSMAYIAAPDKGCGTLGMIIMTVVAIVVTFYSAGAAAGFMGSAATATSATVGTAVAGTTVATGATAGSLVGGGFMATMSVGASALAGGFGAAAAIAGGAVGAFMGSVAGQLAGKALGIVDHFSLRDAAQAGLSAGLTAGLFSSPLMRGISGALAGSRFAQGAASAVASQLTSHAASRIAGVDASFSWRRVAVSAVSAGLTSSAMPRLGPALRIDLASKSGQFAADMVGGALAGSLAMHASRRLGLGGDVNYGRVLSDAFGNTLGNAVSGQHAQWASDAADRNRQLQQASGAQVLLDAAIQGIASGRMPVGHPALMLLGGGAQQGEVLDTPHVPGTRTNGALNLDTVQVSASSNGWDSWVWNAQHNRWVSSGQAIFDLSPRRVSRAEISGDLPRSNEIDFSRANAIYPIQSSRTPSPVTPTSPMPGIGAIGREPISALDTSLSVLNQLGQFSMANSDRTLLGIKDGMNWVRQQSKGLVDNASSPWQAAVGSGLYAVNSVTDKVVAGAVDLARLTTSHQERMAFTDGMETLFTTDPRTTAGAAWGQWNQLSYDDKLSNLGAVVVGLPKALNNVRGLGNVADTARAEIIAESRGQSALLREKYGALSPEQRAIRIDELSRLNYERRMGEAINNQEYVFRYLSEDGLNTALREGIVRGYTTTEFSHSSRAVLNGAQILPKWSVPKYGAAIPVNKLNGFSVARPMGNRATMGWEVFASSYPQAGSGGWSQFLINDVPIDQAYIFRLKP